jgi:hypothetical protein
MASYDGKPKWLELVVLKAELAAISTEGHTAWGMWWAIDGAPPKAQLCPP